MQIGNREKEETLVVRLPCCDSAQIMSRLRRDSGGTWSISTIFWNKTIGELLRSDEDSRDNNHRGGKFKFYATLKG